MTNPNFMQPCRVYTSLRNMTSNESANSTESPFSLLSQIVNELVPLVRQLSRAEYGIALGGAHAKGMDDTESDIDLYLFTRQTLPGADRTRLCQHFSPDVSAVTSWGDDSQFIQGGTDFVYKQRKIECWLRNVDYVAQIIAECQDGIVKHDLVTWTVMGFYNHCTLSDLYNMLPVDDPYGLLARWKAEVRAYPPKLRQAIIVRHLGAARFWPNNFHYLSAIERCDLIYTMGIVQQVVHNLIQVVFAINGCYFPGDKKLEIALDHLSIKPDAFGQRVKRLLFPRADPEKAVLRWQNDELCRMIGEIEVLLA